MISVEFEFDGCFNFVVSGLSCLCCKSGERCNWTFHGAACEFIEGIPVLDLCM